eukprot:5197347-Prorocentrum_lima.AAC.1
MHYVGPNTNWANTAEDGGWQFWCPVCGFRYKARQRGEAVIPANYIWIVPEQQTLPGVVPS